VNNGRVFLQSFDLAFSSCQSSGYGGSLPPDASFFLARSGTRNCCFRLRASGYRKDVGIDGEVENTGNRGRFTAAMF